MFNIKHSSILNIELEKYCETAVNCLIYFLILCESLFQRSRIFFSISFVKVCCIQLTCDSLFLLCHHVMYTCYSASYWFCLTQLIFMGLFCVAIKIGSLFFYRFYFLAITRKWEREREREKEREREREGRERERERRVRVCGCFKEWFYESLKTCIQLLVFIKWCIDR